MTMNAQAVKVLRAGVEHDATVTWGCEGRAWTVSIDAPEFGVVEARGSDAFAALERVREQIEPLGWRIGVAGALADVWPSGMARDQGSGLRAYRMTEQQVDGLVDTFEPVDPATVVTVAEQRAETERLYEAIRRRSAGG